MFPSESCNEDNGAGLPWPKSSYCVYSFNISSFKGEDSTCDSMIGRSWAKMCIRDSVCLLHRFRRDFPTGYYRDAPAWEIVDQVD